MSSLDPMLSKAIATHQAGRINAARVLYERVLRRRPSDPDALNFLGILAFQRGEKSRGIELLRKSLASAPGNAHAWMNLGNMLMGTGEPERGAEAYQRATDLAPDLWQAWMNRAVCLRQLRRIDGAAECLKTTIRLKPDHSAAYERLGTILYRAGKSEELVELYRGWLQHDPDSPTARHLYAAAAGDAVPDRASDEYVRTMFDQFADSFDENLVDLGYRAPQLVADAIERHAMLPNRVVRPDILDAGAGTGLCGPLLRRRAGTLLGVDLSPCMLDKARQRRVYDDLVVMELCAFMRSRPASFDVVVSADTLVYFGALEEAFAAAGTCLRQGGLLAFTVERWETDDVAARYCMGAHGRYMHAANYVADALSAAGFEVGEILPSVLRSELGNEVQGLLVVAQKAAPRVNLSGTAAVKE
jgi:predicted TPR repeat methyltransferase